MITAKFFVLLLALSAFGVAVGNAQPRGLRWQSSAEQTALVELYTWLNSDVKAGEPRGRRLRHDSVVTTLVKKPLLRRESRVECNFGLMQPHHSSAANVAVAVWITEAGHLEPVQATGG